MMLKITDLFLCWVSSVKLAERCVYNAIYTLIACHNSLNVAQHGFLKGKSTTNQLVQYIYDIVNIL